jgi:hypothetical protein
MISYSSCRLGRSALPPLTSPYPRCGTSRLHLSQRGTSYRRQFAYNFLSEMLTTEICFEVVSSCISGFDVP